MPTTTSQVAPYDQRWYDSRLIDRAIPTLVYDVAAQATTLPRKMGKVANMREFQTLPVPSGTLIEGQTPAPAPYSVREVTMTVAQYGYTNSITDMVDSTKPDKHLTEIVEMQGEQAGNKKDQTIRDAVVPNATAAYAATAPGTITIEPDTALVPMDATLLDKMHRLMRNNNAPYYTRIVLPGMKVSTVPVGPCYLVIVHPSVGYTIRDITGFKPTEEYSSQGPVLTGEIGKYKNFRFLETTNGYSVSTEYYSLFCAPNGYSTVTLNGMSIQTYHTPFGQGEDHLAQRAVQGWKGAWVSGILNNAFLSVLATTVES